VKLRRGDVAVFDLGGVIAEFMPHRRAAKLQELTGLSPVEVERRLFGSGMDAAAEIGEYDSDTIVNATLSALDHRLGRDQLIAAWALAFEPNLELLRRVEGLHQRKVLLTNNGPLLSLCLAGPLLCVATAFEMVLCSWQLRAIKPDSAAFDRAAAVIGAHRESLILFDDTLACVAGARRAGWRAIHVEDASDLSFD
jgi:HAD superfamily hydrolase (TIGR01509 family)